MSTEDVPSVDVTVVDLVERAVAPAREPRRQVLGLVGAPGSGKSTVADIIAEAVGSTAEVIEMDAFHLSDELLTRLGKRDRKGAADTFDADGYLSSCAGSVPRTRELSSSPVFDRTLDLAIVGADDVTEECRLIITTGNHLLLDEPPWFNVRRLLDHAWFLETKTYGWLSWWPDTSATARAPKRLAHGRSRPTSRTPSSSAVACIVPMWWPASPRR